MCDVNIGFPALLDLALKETDPDKIIKQQIASGKGFIQEPLVDSEDMM